MKSFFGDKNALTQHGHDLIAKLLECYYCCKDAETNFPLKESEEKFPVFFRDLCQKVTNSNCLKINKMWKVAVCFELTE